MTPTRHITPRNLVLALAATLTLAACGDDKEDATATTVDAAEFVAAENALCVEFGTQLDAVFPDFGGEPTIEQVRKLGADMGPVVQQFHDGVEALVPPADLANGRQALLDALDKSIGVLADIAASDAGAQAALDAGGPPLDEPANAANAIFPGCPAGDA